MGILAIYETLNCIPASPSQEIDQHFGDILLIIIIETIIKMGWLDNQRVPSYRFFRKYGATEQYLNNEESRFFCFNWNALSLSLLRKSHG